jgi:regulation of enolase protein 1 (concanavalin A-like superfamily)
MSKLTIEELSRPLSWQHKPVSWTLSPLSITAGPKTDRFISPQGDVSILNAPSLLFDAVNDFLLSSLITVEFKSAFDAGVLLLYQNERSWAKLCFEISPQDDPMVVSVVTKGSSDDCNSVLINGNSTYLRIAKLGQAFAFHYSTDGKIWQFIRTFSLEPNLDLKAGFLSQSPTGQGCKATFTEIAFAEKTLKAIRSGE